MSSTAEVEFEEIEAAIDRAKSHFKLCPNRVWGVVGNMPGRENNLPSLIPPADDALRPRREPRESHDQCTYEFCEYSRRDFTSVPQRHEPSLCEGEGLCARLWNDFPRDVLVRAAEAGSTTAWKLEGKAMVRPPERYMAISHIWGDGTGAGAWDEGEVNVCLYKFFKKIAEDFRCSGIWWDTISIPQEKAARSKAIAGIQASYEDARITLVHDCFLREWEWNGDARTAAFAIVMSPWFSRGWTSLELAKSRKVKVLFKGIDGYVIKDLDDDILAKTDDAAARAIAKLRRTQGIASINDLLAVLGPRNTSWPRDFAIISGLLVGVSIHGSQQRIYQRILTKMGRISHEHLFHNSATMSAGNYAWCSTSLLSLPPASTETSEVSALRIEESGALVGRWKAMSAESVPDTNYVWKHTHPLTERKLRSALGKHKDRHVLLVEPWVESVSRALLVRVMKAKSSLEPQIACQFLGAVHFHIPHTLQAEDEKMSWTALNIRIGDTEGMEEVDNGTWVTLLAWSEGAQNEDENPTVVCKTREGALGACASTSPTGQKNSRDHSKDLELLHASANGITGKVRELLDEGADPDCSDEYGRTPLHLSTWRGHVGVVELLSKETNCNRNIRDRLGQSPLHLAAERGNERIITLLLDHAVIAPQYKNQPITRAASWKGSGATRRVSSKLLDIDLNGTDNEGKTALMIAVEDQRTMVVDRLLQAGASPNIRDSIGRIPLHWAIQNDDIDAVRLLSKTSDMSVRDRGRKTALIMAVERERVAMVESLLEASAYAERRISTSTPLMIAVKRGHKGMVKLLLRNGKADLDKLDSKGRTRLTLAVERGHWAILKLLLLEGNANVEAPDSTGRTPLIWAVTKGRLDMVELLLREGKAKVEASDSRGRTPLLLAVDGDRMDIASFLTRIWKANAEAPDDSGQTPLRLAIVRRNEDIVRLVLRERNVNVVLPDSRGQTLLQLAIASGNENIVKLLLGVVEDNEALLDFAHAPEEGQAPQTINDLEWTRLSGLVKIMLREGEGDSSFVSSGKKPLFLPATSPLSARKDEQTVRDPRLHVAARHGDVNKVQQLLDGKEVDADSRDEWGKTPLSWAARVGHTGVVRLLVSTGLVDVNSRDVWGETPLSWAVYNGHADIVQLLISTGSLDVVSRFESGETPLLSAVRKGHKDIVKLLLDTREPDLGLNCKDEWGETPLLWAVRSGRADIVRMLLETGKVYTDATTNFGELPFSLAMRLCHSEVVALFEDPWDTGIPFRPIFVDDGLPIKRTAPLSRVYLREHRESPQ